MAEKKGKRAEKSQGDPDKGMQEKYLKAQLLEQQFKQLQKYLETFEEQLASLAALKESLNEFSGLKKGERILAPLTNGIFIRATLDSPSELLINVGQNTVAVKSVPEGVEMLEGQESEIRKYKAETMKQLEELMGQIEGLNM